MGSEHISQVSEDDFEFAILSNDDLVDADEIFVHGIIRPFYLFSEDSDWWYQNVCFGKDSPEKVVRKKIPLDKLIMMVKEGEEQEQHRQSSDELDGIPVDTYCPWTPGSSSPSPDMKRNRKKTKSVGRGALWRLRNLILRWSLSERTAAGGDCKKRLSAPPYKKDSPGIYTGVGGITRAVR